MGYVASLMGEDEQVLYITLHHWTAYAARVWALMLLLIVGVALAVVANLYGPSWTGALGLGPSVAAAAPIVIGLLLVVYPLATMVVAHLRWRADQFIVTNYRVIRIRGILSKSVIDSSLEKVNDVMLTQSVLGRMFDFGDIEIMTSSEVGVNKLTRIARPIAFKRAMLDAKQDLEDPSRTTVVNLPSLLRQLADLRDQGVLTEDEYQAKKEQLLRET